MNLKNTAFKAKWSILNRFPTLGKKISRSGLLTKKYSPELLLGLGIVGGIGCLILACNSTRKLDIVLDDIRFDVENIKIRKEITETESTKYGPYSNQEYHKDLAIAYAEGGKDLLRLYWPALTLGVVSLTFILSSHNMMKKRNVALAVLIKD
jgi:hypothetical protein